MKNCKKLVIVGAGETAMLAYEYFTFDQLTLLYLMNILLLIQNMRLLRLQLMSPI